MMWECKKKPCLPPTNHPIEVTMHHHTVCLLCLLLSISILCGGCGTSGGLFQPSGRALSIPAPPDADFVQYVRDSRNRIREVLETVSYSSGKSPFLGDYSSRDVALMRAPFQIPEQESDVCTERSQGGGKGFLLIHGLGDSPYLMRSIADSLHRAYPCAVIRAVLLPGHGTVPGDMLNSGHEEWIRITDYGVRSFEKDDRIRELYLVGFSAGSALALRQVKDTRTPDKIKGLVLLSPAVKAKSRLIRFAGTLSLLADWESRYGERDAARYESFSYHTAAEFYRLVSGLEKGTIGLDIPVLMAVSADDGTIDAPMARSFFCNSLTSKRRTLIWYRSRFTEDRGAPVCDGIVTVELSDRGQPYGDVPYRTANMSHTALPVSPDDRHYGAHGRYRNCKSYEGKGNPEDFANCQKGSPRSVFGENIGTAEDKQALGYDFWRRGTFNPDYERLEKTIICFVDSSCDVTGSR